MRAVQALISAAALLISVPASAAVIQVSPTDGPTAYTKIEGAGPGDEVVIAPGTYTFRVYLQAKAPSSSPISIHAQDPTNPPVWDLSGTLVENAPGSYTAPDKNRGCWQVSGGTNYHIDGIVFENCHSSGHNSAGLRYYAGTTGLTLSHCVFRGNDNGLTGGTEQSDVDVSYCEFDSNGNTSAPASSPTHNIYIYGGTFALRYSYLHDPLQAENLHCRAVNSTIEYSWFDRAKGYVGDLMTSDDYANSPVGSLAQAMVLRGNVIIETASQANTSQIWAVYNDEASGSPVTFAITALYNTVVGAGGHAAFIHLSNADGTTMTAEADDNIVYGTSQALLVEDAAHATVSGKNNWLQTGANGTAGLSNSLFGSSPGFNAAATQDFTLAAGSPCIGAADTSVGALPTAEYYENETVTRMDRVRATAMDLGAFEHTTAGPGMSQNGPGTDAGADARANAGTDASANADAGANAGASAAGCGCRMSDASSGHLAAFGGLAFGALVIGRRRRSRNAVDEVRAVG